MALDILAEALARIEHKLDLTLSRLTFLDPTPYPQLHFVGTPCPVCRQVVDYQVDINKQVVVRRCGCKTGKLPPLIPLFQVTGPQQYANPTTSNPTTATESEDSRNPKDRNRR